MAVSGAFRGGWRLAARAILLVPLIALPLSGCVSEQREREMGDLMAVDMNAQLPLLRDPVLNAYVSSLGNAMAAVSDRPDLEYRFYVVNTPIVNAFALPGGHIYLTRGLIEQTTTGSELAAALAHEIGHVAERHGVAKMERHLRTGSVVSVLYNVILGGEPEILRQDALEIGGALWSARHSRRAERQADARAIDYLRRAGLEPEAMVNLLASLADVQGVDSSAAAGWFSSHPLTTERMDEVREAIQEAGEEPKGGPAAGLPEYLERYPLFLRRLREAPAPGLLP